jgi:EpsI family protein
MDMTKPQRTVSVPRGSAEGGAPRSAKAATRPGQRSPLRLTALLLAAVLTVSTGLAYRLVAARYTFATNGVSLPVGTLAGVPTQIGEWRGRDLAVSERIIKQTDTDDHLSRMYQRPGGGTVTVWVAYGVRLRDLMPHRPEVCYVGAGWTLEGEQRVDIAAKDGSHPTCRLMTFRKAGLANQQITVLNYYMVGDSYSPDVSSLRSQASRLNHDANYVVQVQIVQEGGDTENTAHQPVCEFASELGPQIRKVIDRALAEGQR